MGIEESRIFQMIADEIDEQDSIKREMCIEHQIEGVELSIVAVRRALWTRYYKKSALKLIVSLYKQLWQLESELYEERNKNRLGMD